MKLVALGTVAELNPSKPKGLQPEQTCSFVPMEAVDDILGVIANPVERLIGEVGQGYTYFANDDVLFAKITPCMENGKCAVARNLVNGIGFGSTEFHVARAHEDVTPEWIYYFLRQEKVRREAMRHMTGSAGQQRVPAAFLREIQIPLPPLAEQQRTAGLLLRADRLRRLRRYALEVSSGYLQAVFLEMFGDPATNPKRWQREYIGDVLTNTQYGTSEKSNQERRGYPVLGMANITYAGNLALENLAYVELDDIEYRSLRLKPGDIIFNRTNSTELVGKTAHWNLAIDAVLASYLVKLQLVDRIRPDFFAALLNTPYYKHLFQGRCKKAVGQSNISPTLLKEFPMLSPPADLQQEYAVIVAKHRRLVVQQEEALRQAEHLFQALLRRAFGGEQGIEHGSGG